MILTLKVTFGFAFFIVGLLLCSIHVCTYCVCTVHDDRMPKIDREPRQRARLNCSYNNESVISVTWTWRAVGVIIKTTSAPTTRFPWWRRWRQTHRNHFDGFVCYRVINAWQNSINIYLSRAYDLWPVFTFSLAFANTHVEAVERKSTRCWLVCCCRLADWLNCAYCKAHKLSCVFDFGSLFLESSTMTFAVTGTMMLTIWFN